jgi:F-box protein, helicase, 18
MELTKEQKDILNSTGNIKINAVAGSGKTTTVIEYAKTRPASSKILYLAFNKSVKLEAGRKFAKEGLGNVKVETAHSLAYRHIVFKHKYTVKQQGYKTNEIVEVLKLQSDGERHTEYIIAAHINKFLTYFCNSDKQKVQDLNYLDTISDSKAKAFVSTHYNYIEKGTRHLLSRMDKGEAEVIHDFYLKKFQLSNPELGYDYILFDEGQDASPAMLDVFLKQRSTKVIVGDTHQQIYGWRYAVNSLEKTDFKNYNLSTSFRFGQDIANIAMEVLKFKTHLKQDSQVSISGMGKSKEKKTKAVLARTNLGLLLKAIQYVTEKEKVKHIYFEGNINSYTYADDGASLYDVLNLYNGKRHLIRDKLIKGMKDLVDLEEYIEKTEDVQLGMMIEIVKKYGNEIPGIIKTIKEKHVENDEKEKAEMIFSTVHRCKGMEYDSIQLVNDFITEEKLEKFTDDRKKDINTGKLNEEINLLYVALTRTRYSIHIPESLLPKDFPASPQIHIEKEKEEEPDEFTRKQLLLLEERLNSRRKFPKTYQLPLVRESYKGAYRPWTESEEKELRKLFNKGTRIPDIALHLNRTTGAIRSRLKKLGLIIQVK